MNTNTLPLILYGTEDCHLCDDVKEDLLARQIPFKFVDIVFDEKLMTRFGVYIPVIEYQGTIWKAPFSLDDILSK